MNFTVKCDKCGSEDVTVFGRVVSYDGDTEVWAKCNECPNGEKIGEDYEGVI